MPNYTRTKFLIAMLLLGLAGCVSSPDENSPANPIKASTFRISGRAVTTHSGPINGGMISLNKTSIGCDTVGCSQKIDSAMTDTTGSFSFPSLPKGAYSIDIYWKIGRITKNHAPLESYSGFLVVHYSNGYALGLGPKFELADTDQVVSFIYDN